MVVVVGGGIWYNTQREKGRKYEDGYFILRRRLCVYSYGGGRLCVCLLVGAHPIPPHSSAVDQCEASKGLDGVNETIVAYWSTSFLSGGFGVLGGCRSIIPLVAHHWRHEIEQKTHFHDREIWLKKKNEIYSISRKKTNSRENKRLLPLFPISLPQSISLKNQIKSLDKKKKKKKPAAATVARSRDCWPG
jgi:hypothetical protein